MIDTHNNKVKLDG